MRFFSSRSNIIITFFFALMALLIGRLFFIAIVDGEEWKDLADQNTIKNLYTDAPRGEIYDRNGVLLATNIASYTVDLSMGDMDDKKMNEVVESLIEIFTRNGDTMSDNFPILLAEDGSFSYIYDQEIQDWLAAQGMPLDFTAKQAFDEIRRRNNISEGMDKYEAQQALIDMNIYPPISVKEFIFTKTSDKNAFLTKFQVEIDTPAKEAFAEIRKKYEIDKNKSDAEARQMMMLRYELTSQGYMKYLPAKIAQDVSKNTVIELGERSSELTGVSVITDSTRSYPMGNHASHILGYLGKISDADKEKYVKNLKYKPTDLIGLDGIEQSQESYLRGTDGVKKLQVNNAGEVIRQVGEETKAVKGKDIILSIDSRLQAVAEEALPKAIDAMHTGGTYQSQYTTYNYTKASPKASMGAAVVLDVKTGAPLAIANS
ncbi:MAG: hypothetical protein LBN22_07970, partial [Clostridiales Family XIII bacterium]|nr:hypothetical protein [Clostridiales Family XIII bacterium]